MVNRPLTTQCYGLLFLVLWHLLGFIDLPLGSDGFLVLGDCVVWLWPDHTTRLLDCDCLNGMSGTLMFLGCRGMWYGSILEQQLVWKRNYS